MLTVQLQELLFDQRWGEIVPGNADRGLGGTERFHDEVNNFIQPVPVVLVVLKKNVVVDIFFDRLPQSIHIHQILCAPRRMDRWI